VKGQAKEPFIGAKGEGPLGGAVLGKGTRANRITRGGRGRQDANGKQPRQAGRPTSSFSRGDGKGRMRKRRSSYQRSEEKRNDRR